LDKLDSGLAIRGDIAIKTAQASYCMNDYDFMRECRYEAFCSNPTVANYLRLFVDKESIEKYKGLAEKRIEDLSEPEKRHIMEYSYNYEFESDYHYLQFFSGHFDKVVGRCKNQKASLGWTGTFIPHGIDLMLLYLYAEPHPKKAVKRIADRVTNRIGFDKAKNLLFFKENYIFEKDVSEQEKGEIFWNTFLKWKENYWIPDHTLKEYVDWLEGVIDGRIHGIVGGKYRRKYEDTALLAAAIGEVKESLGEKLAKWDLLNKYMKEYSCY
jgi:hypothetical protein